MIFGLLIALSVPKFGKLLDLVGASCVGLQSVILPGIFYFLISRQLHEMNPIEHRPISRIILIVIIVLNAIFIGLAIGGTWFALESIFSPDSFTTPCFIDNCDKN